MLFYFEMCRWCVITSKCNWGAGDFLVWVFQLETNTLAPFLQFSEEGEKDWC